MFGLHTGHTPCYTSHLGFVCLHLSNFELLPLFFSLLSFSALYLYMVYCLYCIYFVRGVSEKFQDWCHKLFISNPNYKLQVVPFKVIPLESNALSHPSLPHLHAVLEGFFWDPPQLRRHKVMLIAFFDVRGIVHCEFLLQGQTINQHVYKEILQRLLRSVREKR